MPAPPARTHGPGSAHLRRHQDPLELIDVVPQLPRVAHIDWVALPALDGAGDVHAADGRLDHLLDLAHRQAVAGDGVAPDIDIHEKPSGHPLGVDAARAGHRLQETFDPNAQVLDGIQIGPENLDAHRGADAGAEHVDPGADRHGPGILNPGKLHPPVHLLHQLVVGQGALGAENRRGGRTQPSGQAGVIPLDRAPFASGFELDRGLHHAERRRVGGGFGPSGLAEDRIDLGKAFQDPVLERQGAFRPRSRRCRGW